MGSINSYSLDTLITNSDILKVQEGVSMVSEIEQMQMAKRLEEEKQQEEKQKEKEELVLLYQKIQQNLEIFEPPLIPPIEPKTIIYPFPEVIQSVSIKEQLKTFCPIDVLNYITDTWEIWGEEWPLFVF